MTQRNIESWQRKRIYGLARELDMTTHSPDKDDELHLLVSGITGINSLSSLTYSDAGKVIAELSHRLRFGGTVSDNKHPETPGGVSSAQQSKIWAMMYELAGYDQVPSTASLGDRLAGIIRKELKMDATAKEPFKWLRHEHGMYLTDKVLKPYIRSAKRKAQARSETG